MREPYQEDSAVNPAVSVAVATNISDRLGSSHTRLLDLLAPYSSGTPLAHAR
ncbi:hypothetical protein [Streptomyces virginiae]|uniref:hypothetical protein n=1 Tax=Streptomyces virginiae TaxID=1961 RepID=UPI0032492541